MLPTGGIYAMKKRKKPVQKSPKPPPPEGVKSNPSKRHRDRLNQELNKLTSLLPFPDDVRARLDKLSILRLIVGYLKVKGFFMATMKKKNTGWLGDLPGTFGGNGHSGLQINGETFSEAELLLQALDGFIIAVTADGYVFYVSSTIQDYLGFQQSDVIYQSVFELIHTDDRAMFRCQLHWALNPPAYSNQESEPGADVLPANQNLQNGATTYTPDQLPPENSAFLERNFVCRFRCLLDNSSGFLALTFKGRLKFLHGQNKRSEDGSVQPPQLALFAIASPLQPPSILELRTKTFIFQTKHKLDFTPMACDSRGKIVLGYTEMELCMRGTGYQFIHAADMMYCADNHVRMIKTGESGMTVFRLLTKLAGWIWVQANARLVYKGGRPDCIIARQRALSNEEGEEHLRKRALQLPFSFATGEAVLYQNNLPQFTDPVLPKDKTSKGRKISEVEQKAVDPSSILGAMMKQDESVYVSHPGTEPRFPLPVIPSKEDEGWHIDQNGLSIKPEGDPVLAILETLLENGDVVEGSLQGLDVGDLDLEGWEENLLQMEQDISESTGLVGHLGGEVASFLEDILFKQEKNKGTSFVDGVCPPSVCLQHMTPGQPQPNSLASQRQSTVTASGQRHCIDTLHSPGLHQLQINVPQNGQRSTIQNSFPPGQAPAAEVISDRERVLDQFNMRFNPANQSRQCPVKGDISSSMHVFQPGECSFPTDFSGRPLELPCRTQTNINNTPVGPGHKQSPSSISQMCRWPVAASTVPQPSTFLSPQNLMGGATDQLGDDARNIWEPLATGQPGLQTADIGLSSQAILTASRHWGAQGHYNSYTEQGLPGGVRAEYSQERNVQALLGGSVEYSRGMVPSSFGGEAVEYSRGRGVPSFGVGGMEYHQGKPNASNHLQGPNFNTQTPPVMGHAYQQQQTLSQNQPFSSSLSRVTFQPSTSCMQRPAQQNRCLKPSGQEEEAGYHTASDISGRIVDSKSHDPLAPSAPKAYVYPLCGYDKTVPPPQRGSIPQHQNLEACYALSTAEEAFYFQNIPEDSQLSLNAASQMGSGFNRSSVCQFEPGCPSVSLTDGQQLFSYNIQLEQCHQMEESTLMGFTPAGPAQSHILS
ncbi:aryl hydrocarbon receptor-like [Ambystoma mexicanum]|uniref:aryl hydrocarbon receptor-like n=1 Tax=Ambystoma mexicanum TaxID=8296 RepID=UPI0037E9C7C3